MKVYIEHLVLVSIFVLLLVISMMGCGAHGKVGGDILDKESSIEGGYNLLKKKVD